MKRSRRYIKKQQKKELINRKVLQHVIRNSNICKHAIRELKLAGYGNGEGGPCDWMFQQVIEAVAVFASHGNSGGSAPWEISLVNKLCNWDIISPLTLKDDEWHQISEDGTCQNTRKSSIFKDPNGSIYDINAFNKKPTGTYRFDTKTWEKNDKNITWNGGLFEHTNNILTGRYFRNCNLKVSKNLFPIPTQTIPCVEVEIAPDDWIMAVDSTNTDLQMLDCNYDIDWKKCPCLEGIRLEDVTPELEKQAYIEMGN